MWDLASDARDCVLIIPADTVAEEVIFDFRAQGSLESRSFSSQSTTHCTIFGSVETTADVCARIEPFCALPAGIYVKRSYETRVRLLSLLRLPVRNGGCTYQCRLMLRRNQTGVSVNTESLLNMTDSTVPHV